MATEKIDYPTDDDGELDHEAMAEELGIATREPVFITDNTGVVREVTSVDTETGRAWLRDTTSGHCYDVPLADLWFDWMFDDLTYRTQAFLRDDQAVVSLDAVETLLDELGIGDAPTEAAEDALAQLAMDVEYRA